MHRATKTRKPSYNMDLICVPVEAPCTVDIRNSFRKHLRSVVCLYLPTAPGSQVLAMEAFEYSLSSTNGTNLKGRLEIGIPANQFVILFQSPSHSLCPQSLSELDLSIGACG
jgi:hypothetical protein